LKKDINEGEMKKYEINEYEINIANLGGKFFAFEDRCPI